MSDTVLLVIDIGNTNISLGVFDYARGAASHQDDLTEHWRLSTHREQTSDELAITLRALFAQEGRHTDEVSDVIVCSVVPPLQPIWERVAAKLFGREPYVVGPGMGPGKPGSDENPHEVGADRIVNSVAVHELYGGPAIAVDFGTATTFDCISAAGEYLGGCIFPGIHIAMEALFERTSKLHRVEIARPKQVIGKTTTGSLQSGLLYGYAGMVDSMVERIQPELGTERARVVATGGLAGRIARESRCIEKVEPFLTLQGLRILFEKNR